MKEKWISCLDLCPIPKIYHYVHEKIPKVFWKKNWNLKHFQPQTFGIRDT
jgi:hypothetical protein